MIIEAETTTVVSNIPVGEEIQMGITAKGMARLMANLTNMYNDPKLAVVREYFANGLDSHVRAGQTAPVEVSLPNSYNKMYVVQDFGTGMSVDDIKNIYSQYGESTKGDTNDEVGAFGLGAKSALAIATQFTLVTVKDGVKATVLIRKSGNGSGIPTMSVVSVIDTQDRNGVTVSIPIDDPYVFNEKARNFFKFVDPELVLVDGYAPTSVFDSATKLDTDIDGIEAYVEIDRTYGQSFVVMGQVAYALTVQNIEESARRLGIVASYELRNMPVYFRVPIGSVSLTPNREGLLYDDKTNDMFDILVKAYMDTIQKTAQEEIDAIDNRFDAVDVVARWESRLGGTFQWQGEDIIRDVKTVTPSSTIKRSWNNASTHGSTYKVNVTKGSLKILVTGQPFDKYKRVSNYITDYLAMMNLTNHSTFLFREALDELDTPWVTEHPDFIFEDFNDMIQRVKDYRKTQLAAARALLPKEKRDRAAKLEYPVLDLDSGKITGTPYDEIPTESYYIAAEDLVDHSRLKNSFAGHVYGAKWYVEGLKTLIGEGASVVFISKGRAVESFKTRTRKIDGLRNLKDIAPEIQTRINELMTEEALRYQGQYFEYRSNRRLAGFAQDVIDQILDEDVRNLVSRPDPELVAAKEEAYELQRSFNYYGFVDTNVTVPSRISVGEKDAALTYPLLDVVGGAIGSVEQVHVVRYMNMIYADQLTLVDV